MIVERGDRFNSIQKALRGNRADKSHVYDTVIHHNNQVEWDTAEVKKNTIKRNAIHNKEELHLHSFCM